MKSKEDKKDLISVIIPVFNSEKYIEKCLETITNQTYKNVEIIIINDCSTDNVEDKILRYKNIDNRIIYVKNTENVGVGATRNKGLDLAKGKYIYFLDSDDYIELDCLEELHKTIKENDCFSCMTKGYKDVDGVVSETSRSEEELMLLQSPSVCIRLFNKEVIDLSGIRFSDLKIGEDLEFVFKMMIYNNNISFVDKALYYYVIHMDSSLRSYNKNQLDVLTALENVELYAKNLNKYDNFYDILEFVNVSHILLATIRRIKSFKGYDVNDIQLCIDTVTRKYPNWKKNKYVNKCLVGKLEF